MRRARMDLFDAAGEEFRRGVAPLADRMRPRALGEFVGQDHLLGPGRVLRQALEAGELHSMILWGPPGEPAFVGYYGRVGFKQVVSVAP